MSLGKDRPRRLEILERRSVHDGFFGLEVLTLRHELFAGGWSEPLRREYFRQRRAVTILPYDPRRDLVVLVEQFRAGAIDGPESPWLLEAAAGLSEEGESPEEVARRELAEECGLEARRLERAVSWWSSPGGASEHVTAFIGEVDAPACGGVHGVAGEHEDIRTHVLPATEAFALLHQGRITGASGVVTLLYLESQRPRLREQWGSAGEGLASAAGAG
ncbi:NUDIX domain-containing protein [Geminicoccaceae bacterium 1502E]|nr:NUDIX domain-containing protein [Geminicoccaceae bacterium 1502E]